MQENWGQTTFTCNRMQVVYENSSLTEVYFFDLKMFGRACDSPKN